MGQLLRLRIQESNHFLQAPNVIGNASFHRRGNARALVNAAEIVVHEMESNGVLQILVVVQFKFDLGCARTGIGPFVEGSRIGYVKVGWLFGNAGKMIASLASQKIIRKPSVTKAAPTGALDRRLIIAPKLTLQSGDASGDLVEVFLASPNRTHT